MVDENREDVDEFLEEDTPAPVRRPRRAESDTTGNLPTFVTVAAINLLIFCGERVHVSSVIQILSHPFNPTQTLLGLTIDLLGVGAMVASTVCPMAAGIGMLTKKPWATIPGWIAVVLYGISLALNIYDAPRRMDSTLGQVQGPSGDLLRVGAYADLAVESLFRLVLLGCYVAALLMFTKWIARHRTAEE